MLRAMLRKSWLALLGCSILCATVLAAAGEKGMGEKKRSESWATLPLPRIGIRQEDHAPFGKGKTYIWIRMPQIPFQWGTVHNVFDIHYEEPGGQELLGSRVLEGGVLEVRHRLSKPHLILVSELTPEPGKVKIVVRPELAPAMGADKQLPEHLPRLNMCPTLKRARGCFDSYPDPFPEIIGRCFIFTDKGRTFLDDTVRRKLPRGSDDDPRNNPPWIQQYGPVWRPASKGSSPTSNTWYNSSPDRFTIPIIGVVSRDRKHLIAMVSDTSNVLCQAWAPCIHNYPQWAPKDAPPAERRWRMNVYIMPNDPDVLLERVAKDMPDALKLQEKRVPPEG